MRSDGGLAFARSVVQLRLLVAAGLPNNQFLVDLLRSNQHFHAEKTRHWSMGAAAAAIRG